MLRCNGDTHQAATALKRLCRSHLNWFQMVRTGHLPWPPPQETKTKRRLDLKQNTAVRKGHGWWPWPLLPTTLSPGGLLWDQAPLRRKRRARGVGKLQWKSNFIHEREREGFSGALKEREFSLSVEKLLDQPLSHLQKEMQTTWQVCQSSGANPAVP